MNRSLTDGLNKLNIGYSIKQLDQIEIFYEMLIEKNKVMNLTRITDKEDFYVKHILDSLLISQIIDINDQNIIDIGTGAGFPGIPLKIFFTDIKITLLDSLNKRLIFLNEVIDRMGLNNISLIHGRAEEYGKNKKYREGYDISVSRAVADLSVLSELCIPFVKKGGVFVAYKSVDSDEEIIKAENAIKVLSGTEATINNIDLPCSNISRKLVIVNKKKNTPNSYPRNSGIPSKKPL